MEEIRGHNLYWQIGDRTSPALTIRSMKQTSFYCFFLWSNGIIAKNTHYSLMFLEWDNFFYGKCFQIHNLENVPRAYALSYSARGSTTKHSVQCVSDNIFTTEKKSLQSRYQMLRMQIKSAYFTPLRFNSKE